MKCVTSSPQAFDCFPGATLGFLGDLRKNNSRAWFAANRDAYQHAVKAPAERFCVAMNERLEQLTGRMHGAKVYRIQRDVRFSKDKTPYNCHLHISFAPQASPPTPPAWMFGVDPETLSLGIGIFAFEPAALDAYRRRVQGADGPMLHGLLARLSRAGVRFSRPELRRAPPGLDPASAPGDLLLRKGLTAWIDHERPDLIETPGLIDRCAADFGRLKPVFDWLLAAQAARNDRAGR